MSNFQIGDPVRINSINDEYNNKCAKIIRITNYSDGLNSIKVSIIPDNIIKLYSEDELESVEKEIFYNNVLMYALQCMSESFISSLRNKNYDEAKDTVENALVLCKKIENDISYYRLQFDTFLEVIKAITEN